MSEDSASGDLLDAHHRLFAALVIGLLVFFLLPARNLLVVRIILAWNAFTITAVILAWSRIIFADARVAVKTAKLQDTGRTAIFVFVLLATVASLIAVAALLGSAKGLHGRSFDEHVLLAVGTVVASWLLVHTVFTLHYAHAYYKTADDDPENCVGGGLQFPGEDEPDFLDFAYFSFVIGMTFQVSDVVITSGNIRRLALIHAMMSFAFNTAILALAINVASGLLGN